MAYNELPKVCVGCIHKDKRSNEEPCSQCGPGNLLKETQDGKYHPGCPDNDLEVIR